MEIYEVQFHYWSITKAQRKATVYLFASDSAGASLAAATFLRDEKTLGNNAVRVEYCSTITTAEIARRGLSVNTLRPVLVEPKPIVWKWDDDAPHKGAVKRKGKWVRATKKTKLVRRVPAPTS